MYFFQSLQSHEICIGLLCLWDLFFSCCQNPFILAHITPCTHFFYYYYYYFQLHGNLLVCMNIKKMTYWVKYLTTKVNQDNSFWINDLQEQTTMNAPNNCCDNCNTKCLCNKPYWIQNNGRVETFQLEPRPIFQPGIPPTFPN